MGYDFHITRTQDWTRSPNTPIDIDEWEEAATHCRLIEEGAPWESEDLGLERTFNVPGETAVFAWWRGRIDIKGYYTDKTEEAAEALAKTVGAYVLGDDD
ncbi:hypothetical protein [Kitasatospora sp. NPDC057015]|uniref:hypothetical protein n=1 Tax=Kitasatospora sp. NPDC057015 TaxID=3346001 RepID=UPI0036283E30